MSDNTHYADTFSRSDLFAGIARERHADILSRGHRILFKSGEKLFREGDPALRCYLVLKGRLKMSKLHEQRKEAIFRYINPGELVAAIAVFKGKDYPFTAEAIGAAEVVGWGKETMNGWPRQTKNSPRAKGGKKGGK